MYVLIDMHKMAVVHKHRSREALNALAWIECTNAGKSFPISSTATIKQFTPLELGLLYSNATGTKINAYMPGSVEAVRKILNDMAESDVVLEEVLAQAALVGDGDPAIYSYLKGSKTPMKHASLFDPPAIRTASLSPEYISELTTKPVGVNKDFQQEWSPDLKPDEDDPTPERHTRERTTNPGGASVQLPGEGTLSQRIYARCAAYMEQNSVDKDTARKEVAKTLINEGVNASTARRQTSEWAKTV